MFQNFKNILKKQFDFLFSKMPLTSVETNIVYIFLNSNSKQLMLLTL